MIVTFCGHAEYLFGDEGKEELKAILIAEIRKTPPISGAVRR